MDRVTAGGFCRIHLKAMDIYNDLYDDFRMPVQKPIVKDWLEESVSKRSMPLWKWKKI